MSNQKNIALVWMLVLVVAAVVIGAGCGGSSTKELVLATTTSTRDSGLLDVLEPVFEKGFNVTVKTLAVGTGEALKMGERGDADVLLVHSREAEDEFVKEGFGLERVQVMFNDFIIVGPAADLAGINGEKSASRAFKKIGDAGAVFVSRSDDSGTHNKEMKLWKEAGVDPSGKPWYVETGQGMAETLNIAKQKEAYTLSDRATYVTVKKTLRLVILVEGDKALDNQYGVIIVNPGRHTNLKLNVEAAGDFVQFLTGDDGQKLIGSYKLEGAVLFHPNAAGETRGMGSAKEKG